MAYFRAMEQTVAILPKLLRMEWVELRDYVRSHSSTLALCVMQPQAPYKLPTKPDPRELEVMSGKLSNAARRARLSTVQDKLRSRQEDLEYNIIDCAPDALADILRRSRELSSRCDEISFSNKGRNAAESRAKRREATLDALIQQLDRDTASGSPV
jgi:hypothetical protein